MAVPIVCFKFILSTLIDILYKYLGARGFGVLGFWGFGGSVASDVEWTYVLPAPLAHYVSNPEQDGIAQNGAGNYDYDYPIPCAATLQGIRYQKSLGGASFGPSLLGCLRPRSVALGSACSYAF